MAPGCATLSLSSSVSNITDATSLLETSVALDAQLSVLDKQAAAIIADARKSVQDGRLLPPPPPSLFKLEEARSALIKNAVASLPKAIAAAVSTYVTAPASTASSVIVQK
jgi:hypothetical protein